MTPEMIKKIVDARELLMDLISGRWSELEPWEESKLSSAETLLAEVLEEHGEEAAD